MYQIPTTETPLTQADIIDDCPTFVLRQTETNLDAKPQRFRVRVLVLTQECDLAQGKSLRVVVGVVQRAQHLVDEKVIKASVVRDHVRRGLALSDGSMI